MGVPKFFRWISERYPLCSQLIQENRIPEFDNLYLDMNGIIHNCSHGNNDDVHFRPSEEQIFVNIFNYLETLFGKIRPKKLFFMAVDGVAPRAKINQQRSRRFRTAADAAENLRKARERGEDLPTETAFDSNCITPGTEFMERLTKHLVYFVNKKINEDANWRHCKVVLSGHEVPGEGEHKIMEYIRLARSQSDYNPNTRHCLYGLDADLMMLGLLTHDPHFCLLREEVTFGPQKKKSNVKSANPESQRFYLMHLSLFREYLDLEFGSVLQGKVPFGYDLERVIDDFILMALFVGNDFLPHLPGIHINEGALALMFEMYKKILPGLGGYMNDGGAIVFERVEKLIVCLSKYVRDQFEKTLADDDYFEGKRTKEKHVQKEFTITSRQQEMLKELEAFVEDRFRSDLHFPADMPARDRNFVTKLASELGLYNGTTGVSETKHIFVSHKMPNTQVESQENGGASSEDEESFLARQRVLKRYKKARVVSEDVDVVAEKERRIQEEYEKWKRQYYHEKMHIDYRDGEQMGKLMGSYVQGLQWVMNYYFDGVQSWSWYFPYHYSPDVSDLVGNLNRVYTKMPPFEMGSPFLPFEQLMGVLPVRSMQLIPEAFRELMFDKSSPILDFYPLEFETDLNGKKNDWEAVVKIPFVEEKRLLSAMKTKEHRLTPAERNRNKFGESLIFYYDNEGEPTNFNGPAPAFANLIHCHTKNKTFHLPTMKPQQQFKKGLQKGVKLGVYALAGFPTLHTIPHDAQLVRHGVKVFNAESKSASIILTLRNPLTVPFSGQFDAETLAIQLIGKRVFVGWPFLNEAVVVGMADTENNWLPDPPITGAVIASRAELGKVKRLPQNQDAADKVNSDLTRLQTQYSSHYGVILDPLGTNYLVYACLLKGMRRLDNGALVKDFGSVHEQKTFPLGALVLKTESEDLRYAEKPPPPLHEEFPVGSKGFYLGEQGYGCPLVIMSYAPSGRSLNIKIAQFSGQPSFGVSAAKQASNAEKYVPGFVIAKQLNVSGLAISKITSSVYVAACTAEGAPTSDTFNIGLNLKFEATKMKVVGYTRRTERHGWEYSEKAVELIKTYKERFPSVFEGISSAKPRRNLEVADLIPNVPIAEAVAQLSEVKSWLKEIGSRNFERSALDNEMLPTEYVHMIQEEADKYVQGEGNPSSVKELELNGIAAQMVLLPAQAPFRLSGSRQKFSLGDRVVFVPDIGSISSGATGTVIGVEKPLVTTMQKQQDQTIQQKDHEWITVLFDTPFMGGSDLNGRCGPNRGITVSSETLLNLTQPQPPIHKRFDASSNSQAQMKPPYSHVPPPKEQYRNGRNHSSRATTAPSERVQIVRRPESGAPASNEVWTKKSNERGLLSLLNSPSTESIKKEKSTQARPSSAQVRNPYKSKNEQSAQPQPVVNAVSAEEMSFQFKKMLNIPINTSPASSEQVGAGDNLGNQLITLLQNGFSAPNGHVASSSMDKSPIVTANVKELPTSVLRGRGRGRRGGRGRGRGYPHGMNSNVDSSNI